MQVTFVRPSMTGRRSPDALQPLIFSQITHLTPPEIDLRLVDELITPLPTHFETDVLALAVDTFSAKAAYQIADAHRARGVPVVLGGHHPTMLPDEASEHADAIVVGEAEDTWPQLLADVTAGPLQSRYTSTNTATLPITDPARPGFDRRDYPPLGLVQFSRGCRYSCEFCSVHAFHGQTIRTKTVADCAAEVGGRPERLLFFVDDNLFSDRDAARELFEALVGKGKRWVCQISMDVARDRELLALMRRAGCLMVLIGFESLDADNLRQMRKGANRRASDYAEVIDNIHRAGLMIYGTFVIGYDHDTAATAGRLVEFAVANRFSIANFNPLMPMPGTRLLDRLSAEGRLLHDRWWLADDFRYGDAMFRPVSMTPDELTASCWAARQAFYSRSSIGRRGLRLLGSPTRLGVHVAANVISRRAIWNKQGAELTAS